MKPGRLDAVRRIERRQRPAAPPPVVQAAQTAPVVPARPGPSPRVRLLRELGLSVSVDATSEQLDRLEERFELVCRYVRDVWRALTGQEPSAQGVHEEQVQRFAAHLLDDGRLADALVAGEKARCLEGGPPQRNGEYRVVARGLRKSFPDHIPRPSLFGRLLGRD